MTFNIQVTNGDGSSRVIEKIADTEPNGPYSWMPLHFHANEQETAIQKVCGSEGDPIQIVGSNGDYQLFSVWNGANFFEVYGRTYPYINAVGSCDLRRKVDL